MAICPQCGATVADKEVVCGACNALITTPSVKTADSNEHTIELNKRLEKALHRTEQLSYAAAGLGLAIFAVIIIISFL